MVVWNGYADVMWYNRALGCFVSVPPLATTFLLSWLHSLSSLNRRHYCNFYLIFYFLIQFTNYSLRIAFLGWNAIYAILDIWMWLVWRGDINAAAISTRVACSTLLIVASFHKFTSLDWFKWFFNQCFTRKYNKFKIFQRK